MYCFFFFKQKTAYEMRISDWSSDVCSSDLNEMLALDSGDLVTKVTGRACKDPTFGLDALWIPKAMQNDAIAAGYTVVDPATVVATHQIGRASCRERVCQYV